MNREDIIRMAREAGLWIGSEEVLAKVERFAALVAAAQKEACAVEADRWQTAIHDPRYECDCATAIRRMEVV